MSNSTITVTPEIFRKTLSHFATGVTVITVEDVAVSIHGDMDRPHQGAVHGMTANSFTSVSLDPPLVLVCIAHQARTHTLVQLKGRFGINVLAEHQQNWARFFAQVEQNPAEAERIGVRFSYTERGTPILEHALAHLDCRLVEMHHGGDHTIFVAEVEQVSMGEGRPLLFYLHKYRDLGEAEES